MKVKFYLLTTMLLLIGCSNETGYNRSSLLEKGMSKQEVINILGYPEGRKREGNKGTLEVYDYKDIDVCFNEKGEVKEVDSYVWCSDD
ncbi:Uncharacterised protein [Phocoenobacter uteri]|uniref:SmpA / OmlA family n=2 Tax=Phocoenobacter uteri TaxID=146806 RepID=A0A379CD62_9PAST|nr:hypothetical protein [Phocoenobacter uteri]SUB59665.1 Uncharacterised protein [Phocoenobacter uteri]